MTSRTRTAIAVQAPAEAPRSSERIRADLDAAVREWDDATAEETRLGGLTKSILLDGDDAAADRHDAELARIRRVAARAQYRQDELADELAAAKVREAEEAEVTARIAARAAAEAAVAKVLAEAPTRYTTAAETIAAFLADWDEAENLARAAGIDSPGVTLRAIPGEREPDTERSFTFYLDDQGNRTQNPHPYKGDGTLDRTRTRELHAAVETVPGAAAHTKMLPRLPDMVNLPKLDEAGEHHRSDRPRLNLWA